MADGNVVRARAQEALRQLVTGARGNLIDVPVGMARDACWRTSDDDLQDEVVEAALVWEGALLTGDGELRARSRLSEAAGTLLRHRS